MDNQIRNLKHSKEEDLELIRLQILKSKCGPIEKQIFDSKVEIYKETNKKSNKEIDNNTIDMHIKLFEIGYNVLIQKIEEDAIEGAYSRDAEISPILIEDLGSQPII